MNYTVTYLHWRDACSEEAADPDTPVCAQPLADLHEVGFLISETDESVSLSLELDHDGKPSRWRLHVPKVNIISRFDMPLEKAFRIPKRKARKR